MPPSRFRTVVADVALVDLLVAAAVGVYALVALGAATGILDGVAACRGWPACGALRGDPLVSPGAAAALGHRAAALAVGGLLAWTAVRAWRRPTDTRVRFAVTAVAVLYPAQVWLGALVATAGGAAPFTAIHLAAGVGIFAGVTLALLWQLEAATAGGRAGASSLAPQVDAGTTGGTTGESPPATGASDRAGSPATGGRDEAPSPGLRERAVAYLALTKPKLMWLLCLVALAAMALAGGRTLDGGTVAATVAGGVLAVGASGTFNNVLERDVDRRMARTGDRPLVQGRVPVRNAVAFGLALAVASTAVFLAFVNVLAAALGVLAILYYSVGYTLVLKPNTSQNIVVGGAVGAFPALIGWAAATGSVGVPAVVLGLVVFLWTPAHFYNLAMAYRADYERAEFPMLPVVADGRTTRRHVLLYLVVTMVAAVALGGHARLEWAYAATAVAAGALFLGAVVRQYETPTRRTVLRTFHASNAYLGALLVAIVVDATLV